ncbi:LOW QUALITY PROTEIN: hypothetical protein Cgig2_006294 [Carnegiea gigantea]|uniref:Uncharacterized protein n=1 Tax=Carnegiea gigantea TaxID=171969 RepID=A0A9Q1QEA2_9CARY|nr:LOW QUALITY PROTEIN: hypothetical protein Cgig2_006294 [Carnegiea gigantea]
MYLFWRKLKEEERDSSSDQNIQRDKDAPSSKPKLKIVHSQRPPTLAIEDNSPQTKIPVVGVVISVAPISAIPSQSVAMPTKALDEFIIVCTPDEHGMSTVQQSKLNSRKAIFSSLDEGESDDVNFKEKLGHDFLGNDLCLNDSKSICTPNDDDEAVLTPLADTPRVPPPLRPSRASQDVSVFDIDAVIREVNKSRARMTAQVIMDKVFHTPFERLHCVKGDFDSLYNLINARGGDATPLKNKVEKLIHQACDLKDLQNSYSEGMITESRHIELDSKLNEASHWLDIESTHYNALKAKLEREELLKELLSFDDQKKDLSYQVVANEGLREEAEREVIGLRGQINTINAIEVIDPATKASLERTKSYIKESFEDLKTFQWTP